MSPEVDVGEVTEIEDSDEQIIDLDSEEGETEASQTDVEEDSQDSDEQDQEQEVEEEAQDDPESEIKQQLDRLKAENEKLQKDRDRAFYNLRKAKAEQKPESKDSEVEFSDAQLLQLIEEHREDPAVMLQLMKQVSKQQGKVQAVDAVKSKEIKDVKQQMDNFLIDNFPAYTQEETAQSQELEKARAMLNVDDHPYGDFLSVAGMMLMKLPEIQKQAFENGKAEALKKNGEDTRKRTIKESGLGSGKPKAKLVQEKDNYAGAKAVAKQMGMTEAQTKRYLQIRKSAGRSITVNG